MTDFAYDNESYMNLSDSVIDAQPEEKQSTQEGGLENGVKHSRDPAVDQECQGKERICFKTQNIKITQNRIIVLRNRKLQTEEFYFASSYIKYNHGKDTDNPKLS